MWTLHSYVCIYVIHTIYILFFFHLIFRVWPNKKKKIHCKLTYLIHLREREKKKKKHFGILLQFYWGVYFPIYIRIYWHSFEPSFPRNFYDIIHGVREFIRISFIHSLTRSLRLTSFHRKEQQQKNASKFFITLFMHSNRVAWKNMVFVWQITCSYWITPLSLCLCNSFRYFVQNAVQNNIVSKLKFIITCSNLKECSWSSCNERVHSLFSPSYQKY